MHTIEVFTLGELREDRHREGYNGSGWYYAFGREGEGWESAPVGPYATGNEALREARIFKGTVTQGCRAVSLYGYRCVEHAKKRHIARGMEIDVEIDVWPIAEGEE